MLYSSKKQIIAEIKDYIMQSGARTWSEVYVGITRNAETRLFNEHNLKEEDWWIYRHASSSAIACDVEDYFVHTLGAAGITGEGDHDADYVYAYKKSLHTVP